MTNVRRRRAILLAAAVCVVFLSASVYLVAAAGHSCCGAGCIICYHIEIFRTTLKSTALAIAATALAMRLYTARADFALYMAAVLRQTPIFLKVKLLN